MVGVARDLHTASDRTATVLAEDAMTVTVGPDRAIEAIEVAPDRPEAERLIGARGGKGLRAAIDTALPEDRRRHTPLALLLDDIAGASLVSAFVWLRHRPEVLEKLSIGPAAAGADAPARRPMEGTCAGFRPGSSTLNRDRAAPRAGPNVAPVPSLTDPDDDLAWHELESLADVGMRRARRMDVWREADAYRIDAHFRDSCTDPQLGEVAVHEYSLDASIDVASLHLSHLAARARVLPHAECPAAAENAGWLVGQPLPELRYRVLEVLKGVDCCTHLNDAIRALADVAVLLPAVT
jgi:hypothetical protein